LSAIFAAKALNTPGMITGAADQELRSFRPGEIEEILSEGLSIVGSAQYDSKTGIREAIVFLPAFSPQESVLAARTKRR
jgi:hypothetical protein